MKWNNIEIYVSCSGMAILTNCLGSLSSLNFNLSEKGEMLTLLQTQFRKRPPFYRFRYYCMGSDRKRGYREKNVISDTLRRRYRHKRHQEVEKEENIKYCFW